MRKSNLHLYRAEFACPQCGAPVILDETEFVINCAYCRTNVILVPDRYFQYYFPPSESKEYIFIPYWRLRGCYYRIHNPADEIEILTKFIDSTILAVTVPHIPFSLGIRTQNLTLKPLHEDIEGNFLKPEIPLEQVRGKITRVQVSTQKMNRSIQDLRMETQDHYADMETQNVTNYDYFSNLDAGIHAEANLIDLISTAAVHFMQNRKHKKTHTDLDITELKAKAATLKEVNFQEFIGEIISLIHYPVYFRQEILCDGILDEPLSRTRSSDLDIRKQPSVKIRKNWHSQPLQCPDCGWNLDGKTDSILFHCSNCSTQWLFHDKKLQKCAIYHLEGTRNSMYMPCWKLKISCSGFSETVYRDQKKRNFTWLGSDKADNSLKTELWTPALRLLPDEFLSTAVRFNNHAPYWKPEKGYPDATQVFPVTLPISEAIESLNLILFDMTGNKSKLAPHLPELQIEASEARVIFIPFDKQGIDLVQPDAQFAIRHASIRDRTRIDDVLS